jgi:hypothetical protein
MNDDQNPTLTLPELDINADGHFTISDVGEWTIYLLHLPGDLAIAFVIRFVPALATFLELGPANYGGTLSLFISILTWSVAIIAVGLVVNAIRNLDRWVTNWIVGHLREGMRVLRVLRRRLVIAVGTIRRKREASASNVIVSEVDLENFDAAVLRCYADVGDRRILCADDVARVLKASLRQVQHALRRLGDYRLIEPASRADGRDDGHTITQAGQIYLIEH